MEFNKEHNVRIECHFLVGAVARNANFNFRVALVPKPIFQSHSEQAIVSVCGVVARVVARHNNIIPRGGDKSESCGISRNDESLSIDRNETCFAF